MKALDGLIKAMILFISLWYFNSEQPEKASYFLLAVILMEVISIRTKLEK